MFGRTMGIPPVQTGPPSAGPAASWQGVPAAGGVAGTP